MIPMLIGSRAMDFQNNDQRSSSMFSRKSSDWDFITDRKGHEHISDSLEGIAGKFDHPMFGQRYEWHPFDKLNNQAIYEFYRERATLHCLPPIGDILVAPLGCLALLKRSHAWRAKGFQKTIHHLHWGGLINFVPLSLGGGIAWDLMKEREELTREEYPQGNPTLNKTVEEFFDDSVDKVYDHDWLHSLYAYEEEPMFTRLQPNPDLAWCSRSYWERKLTKEQKLQCVSEECYVIATERFLVPQDWPSEGYYPTAFNKALEKVCTTLCSGWFRDFAIDNFRTILGMRDAAKFNEVRDHLRKADAENTAKYHNNKEGKTV